MKDQHLVQWFRQMAVLLNCGLPATRAIDACSRQSSDARIKAASAVILDELRVGQRFSTAVKLAGAPFSALHCGAIEVGERQGDLGLVFDRLATHTEEAARVRRRVVAAVSYPAFVVSFSLVSLYFLVRFLAPVLADVARQLGQEPTAISEAMIWLGWLFESESLMALLAATFFFGGRGLWRYLLAHHRGPLESGILRLPLFGRMLRLATLIRICGTLEMMIGAGLPLTEAFSLAARSCGSHFYAHSVLEPAMERVRHGESVCASLRGSPGLPASFSGLILAGEESGRLEESFAHLGRLYEMELVSAVEAFLAALEPIAIAVVGSVVLAVLLIVFIPLSKLVTAV